MASKAKSLRPKSSPISVPGKPAKSTKSLRRKSILKNCNMYSSSLESDITPASSPDSQERTRRVSQVRFIDELENDEKMLELYANHRKQHRKSAPTLRSGIRSSSLSCDKESDSESTPDDDVTDDSDTDTYSSSSLPVLHISATMSHEAQYAILKTYEDELCDRIEKLFPDIAMELKRNRTPDNRDTIENDGILNMESSPRASRVADRLLNAIDILNSVRESSTKILKSRSNHKRSDVNESRSTNSGSDVSKESIKQLEKWCQSLHESLDELDLNCNRKLELN